MSDVAAKAPDLQSSDGTKESSLTEREALAIAWTGIEALGKMGLVRLFHSPKTGQVWVLFSRTKYEVANGLVYEVPSEASPLATGEK